MSTSIMPAVEVPFVLHLGALSKKLDDADFYELCQANQDWRIERSSDGDIIIMPPTGGETGRRNFDLSVSFGSWARADGTGVGFDSSTVFTLPNGAKRSPDLAWVKLSRWNALTDEERRKFPPLCPDFVVELRSHSDSLSVLKSKMEEYVDNGADLGWLIDPIEKKVYIYRPGAPFDCLDHPLSVSGEPLLKGFVLHMSEIW